MKETGIKRKLSVSEVDRVAEILKTIGHPVRLQIMEILEKQEPLSVSEIQLRLGEKVEQSMLSHHLIKMKDKGILYCEKQGMNVLYGLKDRTVLNIFDCMGNCKIIKN